MPDIRLYCGDCLTILPKLEAGSVDLIFADPPFNVGKEYGEGVSDSMPRSRYLEWCNNWIAECYRALKPGGSIYVMNLERNAAHHIVTLERLGPEFQNNIIWRETQWVTPKIRYGKAHQDIVFFTKPGALHTFNVFADRMPHDRFWGGKEKHKRPEGARLTDIWQDISRVKGNFGEAIKGENGKAHPCQMPVKLAKRILLVSSNEGDTVMDPFMGSATMGIVCLENNRDFIGIEKAVNQFELAERRIREAQAQGVMPLNQCVLEG